MKRNLVNKCIKSVTLFIQFIRPLWRTLPDPNKVITIAKTIGICIKTLTLNMRFFYSNIKRNFLYTTLRVNKK